MPTIDPDEMTQFSKQLEGNALALNAVAELIQKMDARLTKQEADDLAMEEEDYEKRKEEEDEMAYEAMVKSITDKVSRSVIDILQKQDQPMAELNSDKAKKVGGTKWPMSSNKAKPDQEESDKALDEAKTEEVQKPIEAMEKQGNFDKGHVGKPRMYKDEEEEVEEEYPMEEEEGAEEYPMEDEEMGEEDELQMMRKQIGQLQAQLANMENNMEGEIKKEAEERLRKMGFKEETGLVGPKLMKSGTSKKSFGLEKKGKTLMKGPMSYDDKVEALAKLNWSDLNEMRWNIESGQTDGVPRELLEN